MSIDSQKFLAIIKKRSGLTAAITATVVVLGVLYLRFDQLSVHEAQLADLQGNLVKLQRNVANSAQLDRQLAELKVINEKIALAALRPAELARNLQYFYTLEADNGVKLLDLQQQGMAAASRGAAAPAYAPITFSVNLAGDYEHLLQFMREVEKTFLGGKVLSATISPGSALPGQDANKARLVSMVVQTVANNK